MLEVLWLLSTAQASCGAVSTATCSPEGIALCGPDGVCDLAPYQADRKGVLAYVLDDPICGTGRCVLGTDAHGNAFCCDDLPDRIVLIGSDLDDEVSTWVRPPLFPVPDGDRRLRGTFRGPVDLKVHLGAGDDALNARQRSWTTLTADGGDGNDLLIGGGSLAWEVDTTGARLRDPGRDLLSGGDGADVLQASAFSDHCVSGATPSSCVGDLLFGGRGPDRLVTGHALDVQRGGPGDDLLSDLGSPSPVEGNLLDGGTGNDVLCGAPTVGIAPGGVDNLIGGAGDDSLFGRSPAGDTYDAGSGADLCDRVVACESTFDWHQPAPCPIDQPGNVLVIVLDDIGTDALPLYGGTGPSTPTLDSLAASGVTFDHAWSMPLCSPTRAALMTGRHAVRTGLGRVLAVDDPAELSEAEVTLPEVVARSNAGYTSIAIGKWHLAGLLTGLPFDHPMRQGFATHRGSVSNLNRHTSDIVTPTHYYHWQRCEDGACALVDDYATERTVDDALTAIAEAAGPWFAYVAFNAAHLPFQAPPDHLNPAGVVTGDGPVDVHRAMVLAADLEIGRLLEGLGPDVLERTTIIVVGDNGTPGEATAPPADPTRAKMTLFEGGIRVPLIVSGPLVTARGTRSPALVNVVDVLPTVADVAGVSLEGLTRDDGTPVVLDGQSLVPFLADPLAPGRTWNFSSLLLAAGPPPWPNASYAVRDAEYKLIVTGAVEQLYRPGDGEDGDDLLAAGPLDPDAEAALESLRSYLAVALSWPYEP